MNKFYIITNNEKDKNLEFTDRVVDYLGKRGGHCEVQLAGRQTAGPFHYTDPRKIPEETQCIIVLGGDGTLLQAARDIQAAHDKKRSQIPLLGVNLGNLGFLAEVDRQSVYQALNRRPWKDSREENITYEESEKSVSVTDTDFTVWAEYDRSHCTLHDVRHMARQEI